MVTLNSLIKYGRFYRRNHCWSAILWQCPQKRGRLLRIYIATPRKPNSARRHVGKIRLSSRRHVLAKLPGRGSLPTKFAIILVRGHGYKDTPGVGYTMIRGALECLSLFNKRRRRSIYGAKKN